MEGELLESRCDACGLCIDTCPTGALTENFKSKILPLPYEKLPAIDPFGSEGFEVDLLMYKNKVYGATSREGIVNQYGLINREIKFGYNIFNRKDRITQPLLRENGVLKPITKEEAIEIIHTKTATPPHTSHLSPLTSMFVSPELTNESMYMIQKWARAGVKTNAITSTSHINKGIVFNLNKNDNLPLHELEGAKRVYIMGANLAQDHPVVSHIVQNMRFKNQIPVTYITQEPHCFYTHRADETITVNNYHAFVRAINYYLLKNEKAFGIFIDGLAVNFNEYKEAILLENYQQLLEESGVDAVIVEKIAQEWIEVPEAVVIVSEKTIDQPAFCEVKNSMYLTEKQGKMHSGIMTLKTACNSQGLFDMGILPEYGPGFRKIEGDYLELLKKVWKTDNLPVQFQSLEDILAQKGTENIFIFGENLPVEHPEMVALLKSASFVCVQSLFENDATTLADLVLPMNFAVEIGGSYTTTFKVAQTFKATKNCEFDWNDYQFYTQLQEAFGITGVPQPEEIFLEMISLLQSGCRSHGRHRFE